MFATCRRTRPRSPAARPEPRGRRRDNISFDPSISADGRLVSFTSQADNLDPPSGSLWNVYVRDLQDLITTLEGRGSRHLCAPQVSHPDLRHPGPRLHRLHHAQPHARPAPGPRRLQPGHPDLARLTVGTPDANARMPNATGYLKAVRLGDLTTPADDSDVRFVALLTDVRETTGLGDYAGELEARIPITITDKISTPPTGGQGPGTTSSSTSPLRSPAPPPATPRSAPSARSTPPPTRSCPAQRPRTSARSGRRARSRSMTAAPTPTATPPRTTRCSRCRGFSPPSAWLDFGDGRGAP